MYTWRQGLQQSSILKYKLLDNHTVQLLSKSITGLFPDKPENCYPVQGDLYIDI